MSEMFGHTWLRDQGDEPNDTWIRGLAGLSTADLGKGLIACRDSGKTFPPSLPEFRAMCLGTVNGFTASDKRAHQSFEPLPALENKTLKERQRAERTEALRKLREEVGL